MKAKLELELTPKQYQQLVECYFTGSVHLSEDLWPINAGNSRLEKQILKQASKFGKEDMVFTLPNGEISSISVSTEERLLPYLT